MKVEKLAQEYLKVQEKREAARQEVKALQAERKAAEERADKLAAAGDLKEYEIAQAAIKGLDARIDTIKEMLTHNAPPVSKEDAATAWREYIKKGDGEFNKAWSAYQAARDDAAIKFNTALDILVNNFRTREALALYSTGSDKEVRPFKMATLYPQDIYGELEYIRATTKPSADDLRAGRSAAGDITRLLNAQHTN